MQILSILTSLLLLSGFYFLGKFIVKNFKAEIIISNISELRFQYISIGIIIFIFLLYPIFFFVTFKKNFFIIISVIILIFGVYNFLINFLSIKKKLHFFYKTFEKNIINFLIFGLIFLYFLISITPITSGDSVAYHMSAAKYIFLNGKFPSEIYNSSNSLVGAGEFLNAFALSVGAFQFTSLINFIGILSMIGVIKKTCEKRKLDLLAKNILILCVLSTPVLIFLTPTSKSQLFATSLTFLSYSFLFYLITIDFKIKNIEKYFFICAFLCIISVQTKISFSLSFFIIISIFYIYNYKKKEIISFSYILILLISYGLLPAAIWKQGVYDYNFINFFLNPFPLNIPGYSEVYLNSKNYLLNKFPLIIFFPLSLSDLTQFLGISSLLFFIIIFSKFQKKKTLIFIILSFILIFTLLGQKTPRFYLEIYLFIILVFSLSVKKFQNIKSFKIFKVALILQSIFVVAILIIGNITLLPGIFSENLNKKILSNYAHGYNIYKWANSVLPKNANIITNHRSTYFLNKNHIFFEMSFHSNNLTLEEKKFYIKKIKEKKPDFIIFYGYQKQYNYGLYNFEDCISNLFKKKNNVGFHETRNIFNANKKKYNSYIYKLDYNKLPECVKYN